MKIFIVSLGPGEESQITPKAKEALEASDVIVGYEYYIELIKELIKDKKIISSGMKNEVERCELAVKEANLGQIVSVVSSGDAGVYGMASLVYEVSKEYKEIEIEVVSGITAACSAAAVLGAPLSHDFAVISLSDLLTPWATIEKRLAGAGSADFVICLYNPSSKKRSDYLEKACEIVLRYKDASTCCGFVQHVARDGEKMEVCSLKELKTKKVDMFTTVIIGNSQTKLINGKLVTPRGYRLEA